MFTLTSWWQRQTHRFWEYARLLLRPLRPAITLNSHPITCVMIADTHSQHASLPPLPWGDILIHAGDCTQHGTIPEILNFFAWFTSQPHTHKIFIAGNHDHSLDPSHAFLPLLQEVGHNDQVAKTVEESHALTTQLRGPAAKASGTTYLDPHHPSTTLTIHNRTLTIYGLPYTPGILGPNAFLRHPTLDTWAETPEGADILVSHTPPRGVRDRVTSGEEVGCESLRGAVERVKPRLVVCGHIHEGKGRDALRWGKGGRWTVVVNAAVMGDEGIEGEAQVVVI